MERAAQASGGGELPEWGAGYSAAGWQGRHGSGPCVTRAKPRSGPREGGTTVTLEGFGFRATGQAACRFAFANDVQEVPAEVDSELQARCITPHRGSSHTSQVTFSNDGVRWSAAPVQTAQGSGCFTFFSFAAGPPAGHMALDNSTGPFSGGTLVTISLHEDRPFTVQETYHASYPGAPDGETVTLTYSRTEGVPMSRFEPSALNSCLFGDPRDGNIRKTDIVKAVWRSYTKVQCYSPPGHDVSQEGRRVPVLVSNNGADFSMSGGNFTYEFGRPEVDVFLTTSDGNSRVRARSPFHGNAEVTIIGRGFQPSEYLTARFEKVLNDEEYKDFPCFYDSSTQVRCVTPAWEPDTTNKRTSLSPGFEVEVSVSNDAGLGKGLADATWSFYPFQRFVYCDIIVAVDGSDTRGDGTYRLPFRSIARGIQGALSNPRAYFISKGDTLEGRSVAGPKQRGVRRPGLPAYINSDKVRVGPGGYKNEVTFRGLQHNLYLSPHKKVIEVIGEGGAAYIDCQDEKIETVKPFQSTSPFGVDLEVHGVLIFRNLGFIRCRGTHLWNEHESKRPPDLTMEQYLEQLPREYRPGG